LPFFPQTRTNDAVNPDELPRFSQVGGGGAGLTFAKVVKSSDETVNNSTVLQDDDELRFTPRINLVYAGILICFYDSGATPDIKFAFSLPAAAGGEWVPNAGHWQMTENAVANILSSIGIGGGGVGTVRRMEQHFRIRMGAVAGDAIVQWAQNTANVSDTKVLRGSLLLVWEE